MRELRNFVWIIGLIAAFSICVAAYGQTPTVTTSTIGDSDVESLYQEGLKCYYQKDYARAVALFKQVQGIAPEYRKTQIVHYLRTSESRLGKQAPVEVYKVPDQPTRTIEIQKENELEAMAEEAQKVILDAYALLESFKKEGKVTGFELVPAESSLKMAKAAYEDNRFTEAIRLANKARFQLSELANLKKPGVVLGKSADIPVTLNLTDADLQQTLKLIYDLTGANIVMSQGITGRVTINVKDLPLQRVLDLICEANNLKYVEDDGVIKIMTVEEFQKSSAAVKARLRQVFQVRYGDANSIMKALKETFRLDSIVFEPRTNSIIVDAPDEKTRDQIGEVISTLDTPISEVLLEAKLVEFDATDENALGIDWLVASRLVSNTTVTGPKWGSNPNYTPGVSSTLPENTFSFGVTNSNVNSLIQALSAKGQVHLIQAPKIMCLNGTMAIIAVEENVPYLIPQATTTITSNAPSTTSASFNVYEDQVGTEFTVTPIIQRNRSIFLNLSIFDSRLIEIRRLTSVVANQTYSTDQPVIASRQTNQSIVVYDGQTLIIGGMIQNRKELKTSGVPFLQRIPLLGYLFKKPTYSVSKSELLLFLTPHVVGTYTEADQISKPDVKKLDQDIKPGLMEKF